MVAASPSADRLYAALYGTYPMKNKGHGLGYRTRKVAVIGLADLERRALRGRSRVRRWDLGCKITEQENFGTRWQGRGSTRGGSG